MPLERCACWLDAREADSPTWCMTAVRQPVGQPDRRWPYTGRYASREAAMQAW